MLRGMNDAISVTIVGAGRLGSALATALTAGGFRVDLIVSRDKAKSAERAKKLAKSIGARTAKLSAAKFESEIVWFCVPDGEIAQVARFVQERWKSKVAFHSSGALSSDALEKLRKVGASVASVHPLMTFADGTTVAFKGMPFGLEGDKAALVVARRVVAALGGESFTVSKKNKAAYHAWGMFASPLLIALLRASEEVAGLAKVADARGLMLPMVRQTIANYAALGPERAFTGPIMRGDVKTVQMHLRALKRTKELRAVYVALARAAAGRLPTADEKKMKKILRG